MIIIDISNNRYKAHRKGGRKDMNRATHLCRIPCNSLPLVGEADFGLSLKPMVHCDRIAEFNVLIYVLKGGMQIVEDGTIYELSPHTLFFLKSGVHHWGEKPFESGTAWYYIHFYNNEPPSNMPQLKNNRIYGGPKYLSPSDFNCYITIPKLLNLPVGNEFEKEIEKLIDLFKSAVATDMIRANVMLWEILLHSFDIAQGKVESSKEDRRTQRVIDFLEQHYCRNFTAEELEKAVGLTYKYIGTLFKLKTGMTIKEYQSMLRIRKAERLLCETEMSVAEIASETGFYDTFYFSKVFKRKNEISPQKFRNVYLPRI